jgi:prepilin-type N-terminal cleavage/methylation domain-containing protein
LKTVKARAPSNKRSGVTLLELIVVMAVMTVAVSMFTSMVVHTARQRGLNRENAIASNAARTMLEWMRNEDFHEIFARFNADPNDDPAGPGTAPGSTFDVPGLTPLADDLDQLVGEIHMPVIVEEESKPPATWGTTTLDIADVVGGSGLGGLGGMGGGGFGGGGGGGGGGGTFFTLREDFVDKALGMPRDLNGDSLVDDCDHASDYVILPVHVSLEWRGDFGPRRFDLYTQIAIFAKEGE